MKDIIKELNELKKDTKKLTDKNHIDMDEIYYICMCLEQIINNCKKLGKTN